MLERIFPRNQHPIERILRVVVGLVLLSLVFVGPQTLLGLVGIVPLLTGFIGSCPLYTACGMSTCSIESKEASRQAG